MDLFIIIIIFIWLFFGYAASTIASSKGRNRVVWFCAGLIFGPFALVVYLLPPLSQQKGKGVSSSPSADKISLENGTKKCPMCAEMVKLEAQKCRFCGHLFDPGEVARQVEEAQANLQARLDMERAGRKQCPQCGGWDVQKAYIEDGSWGDWCTHCKKSLQKMKGNL